MHSVALILYLSALIASGISTSNINYCGARMCDNSDNHTFCQYREGPSSQCVGYISAEMSMEEKSRVIARLNRRRNEAAAGLLQGLPPAGNMLKMRWVEELAREAQLWADQCISPSLPEKNDECRDLYSVPVGQCVASVVGEAPGLRVESMVDIWYMQSMFYKGNVTMYMLPNSNNTFYGDFAQMMWAKSYMVGCGRSRFMNHYQGRLRTVERLVCNIAPAGPPPGRSLWSPSAPASLCPSHSRPDRLYTSLCDLHNELLIMDNVDPSMTLEEHTLLYTVLELESNTTNNSNPGALDQVYLTKLAVASIKNIGTTDNYFKSILKKDIVEIIGYDGKTNLINVTYMQEKENGLDNNSNFLTTAKVIKQRISFIGRPRPYNMAELTDIEYKTENYTSTADLTEENDYSEYEFVDTTEDNSSAQKYHRNATKNSNNDTLQKVVTTLKPNDIFALTTEMYQNSTLYEVLMREIFTNNTVVKKEVNNVTESQRETSESTVHIDDIDEYLQDPETVRELQEALDRMERELSEPERQGKVRRELRKLPRHRPDNKPREFPQNIMPDIQREQKGKQKPLDMADITEELEQSRPDKGAIYNMVMKYMPMFKQYGDAGGLMPKVTSHANCLSSSFILVLSLYL